MVSPLRKNAFVVYNPAAGQNSRVLQPTLKLLRRLGVECVEGMTEQAGHAQYLVATAVKSGGFDVIVAAGGDGTINEAITGIGGSGMPLGIIPIGTANVLAMEIGLRLDPDAIARTIAFGLVRNIHLGLVDGRVFFLMASAGFDARVVAGVSSAVKKIFGKGAYALSGLRQIARANLPALKVTVEGEEHDAAWAIVSNAKLYGGKYLLAPDTDLYSPGFSVVLFQGNSALGIMLDLWAIFRGRAGRSSRIKILQGADITIAGDMAEPAQADGDLTGRLPVSITSSPHSLNLIVPDS